MIGRVAAILCGATVAAGFVVAAMAAPAGATAPYAGALTRAPNLTDLVGNHVQIGDVQAGKATGAVFDDAAFGTSRLGVA